MTLDGKIATTEGHAAWVTSPAARQLVFRQRALSDAVIIGGQTLRRDDPQLTTRAAGGHVPIRVVMSRTMQLPTTAKLWDVSAAPTIVMTQRGARRDAQAALRRRGVEVIELDFLGPGAVMDYCAARGFLQCLWECGGTLSAPAIADGAIHKVMAFVAPKLIGGSGAPSPVGDLGFVEMSQAIDLIAPQFTSVSPDLLITGYLPASGGLGAVAARAAGLAAASFTGLRSGLDLQPQAAAPPVVERSSREPIESAAGTGAPALKFYKAWGRYGALSNFSPHNFALPGSSRLWASVEHYYQAHKFDVSDPIGRALADEIADAATSELAARIGRRAERDQPTLVRRNWASVKVGVMHAALRAKFATHGAPRALLLSTGDLALEEASPHDLFWGGGWGGDGSNTLGRLLMEVRAELSGVENMNQTETRPAREVPTGC